MMSDVLEGSKGLGFPMTGLAGVGQVSAKGEDGQEAARVFYKTATRATQLLVIGVVGDGELGGD
jgi:hypothetical protein